MTLATMDRSLRLTFFRQLRANRTAMIAKPSHASIPENGMRYKPGSKKRNRAERKALKATAELSQTESGEDSGSEGEETGDNYSCLSLLPPSSRIPRTCTVLQANCFIANSTRHAYPDTQAEISVTNDREHFLKSASRRLGIWRAATS